MHIGMMILKEQVNFEFHESLEYNFRSNIVHSLQFWAYGGVQWGGKKVKQGINIATQKQNVWPKLIFLIFAFSYLDVILSIITNIYLRSFPYTIGTLSRIISRSYWTYNNSGINVQWNSFDLILLIIWLYHVS